MTSQKVKAQGEDATGIGSTSQGTYIGASVLIDHRGQPLPW